MKVLFAEDSQAARALVAGQLKRWGYDPILATNGREALEVLEGSDPPRLAILDWQMPEVDGVEVCRRIKDDPHREFVYVIILSARDGEDDMVAGLSAGADDYLPKSSNPILLKSRLVAASRILQRVPPREWSKPAVEGFTIDNLIGKGAFATVWKGTQDSTGRTVALKLLRMDLSTDGVFDRFAREIHLMEKLDHPNIAAVYESRIDRSLGYCAMEFINGQPLQKFLKEHHVTRLDMLELVSQICDGLQHAHERGIIHRDVKPSNIMVTKHGQPKLVDFGLGRNLFRTDPEQATNETMDGYVVGTPMYMAPEQARGENDRLDGRADLYAVAIILYIGLVRRHPHDVVRESRSKTINEVAFGEARRPSEVKADFDPELERILMKALARDPSDRYASAGDFASDLRQFAAKNA